MKSAILLRHYSIATRIGIVIGIILLLMLTLAFVEMRGLNSIRQNLDEIVGQHRSRLQIAHEMRFLARHAAVVVRNILLVSDSGGRARELARFEEAEKKYDTLLAGLQGVGDVTEDEGEIIASVRRCSEITFSLWRAVIYPDSGGSPPDALALLKAEVRNHQWGLLDDLERLVKLENRRSEVSMQNALQNHARLKSVMVMINVLAIGAGLFFMAAITASIVGPLSEIGRKVDRIAGGDFSTRIDLAQDDEIGQLAAHINRMVEKLAANEEELEEYRYHLEELIELRTGEVNEQRERFVSVLIHDLKGTLVPIIGFSKLLGKQQNLTPEKIELYAGEIEKSTTKLATVIEQTTRSLREKRMAFSFDREPFDLQELLHSVARSALPAFTLDGLKLTVNGRVPKERSPEAEPLMFSGDIGKPRSVMENLIGNAGEYASSQVAVALSHGDERVRLVVDDDGRGVAEPFRRKIFEEYYQVPGSKSGTGVGLYSVRRIVDHYDGTITVATSPLGGARFEVSLPLL